MTKDCTIKVRMAEEDYQKLEAIRKAYRVDSISQVIRTIIRETADRLNEESGDDEVDYDHWRRNAMRARGL